MKLITNRISMGKAKRFEDFVAEYQSSKQLKTASVKTATEEQEEAESSGQLDVEPLHQTGESTTMPKNGPSAKTETDEKSVSAIKESDEECSDSGQPKAEGSEKFTNDPKAPTKEEKGGSTKKEIKVAEDTCAKCECSCSDCKCKDCDCKSCTAAKEEEIKTAGEKGNCSKCGKPNFLCRGKCSGDGDESEDKKEDEDKGSDNDKKEDEDKGSDNDKKEDKKEDKEAVKKVEFVKIGNLDDKNKTFLKTYWRQLFGDDYVNALISDK